jgi:hypothetical protein
MTPYGDSRQGESRAPAEWGDTLVSIQDSRSALADRCLAEFRQEALRIMQHTCAELSATPGHPSRPSLRARTGWRLVDIGLRLASEPRRH